MTEKIRSANKLLTDLGQYTVTDASVHDSQETEPLVEQSDKAKPLYADSAYAGEPIAKALEKIGVENQIHQRAYSNKPLTDEQKERHREKSHQV